MDFRSLLEAYRIEANLSKNELARLAGIDGSYLSRVERGIYPPPRRDKILAIASALGLTQEEKDALLLSAEYAPDPAPKEEPERQMSGLLIQRYRARMPEVGLLKRIDEVFLELGEILHDDRVSATSKRLVCDALDAIADSLRAETVTEQ